MRDRLRPGTALVIMIIGFLAAGCAGSNHAGPSGSSGAGPAESAAATTAPSAAAPPASASAPSTPQAAAGGSASTRCHTSQLSGRIRMLEPAAGNRYAALILTNTSGRECHTYGFVGLQLAGAKGDLPTAVVRETQPAAVRVTLRPGQSAWTRIHWTVASGSGEPATGQCEPTPSRLLVIPPDERTQLTATWTGGSVCEHGKILTTPLAAGTG